MTLNLVLNKEGVEMKRRIEGVYQVGESYNRIYIQFFNPEISGWNRDHVNYPVSEIVDLTIDLVR